MNDLDLLAAARRPIPEKEEPEPETPMGEVDAARMCREILLAIPSCDYDLRARVTDFFDRIVIVTGKHVVDPQLLYAYRETSKDMEEHVERQQRDEAAHVLAKYVVQAWKDAKVNGYLMRELTTQVAVIKPRIVRRGSC